MKEYLHGPLFEVEVHDRDRVVHKFQEGGSLFGEERDDHLLGLPNTGLLLCGMCRFSRVVCSFFELGI